MFCQRSLVSVNLQSEDQKLKFNSSPYYKTLGLRSNPGSLSEPNIEFFFG